MDFGKIVKNFRKNMLTNKKNARRIDPKNERGFISESLNISTSSKKTDGAHKAGSREWNDGEAIWYEMVPPVIYRNVDGTTQEFSYVLISRVDGMTRAYGAESNGNVWQPSDVELYSEHGDKSCEDVMSILGYSIAGDTDTVVDTKETGAKSVESYEEYEDEKYEEEETPEGETGTPEPHETKTPEPEETDEPEYKSLKEAICPRSNFVNRLVDVMNSDK